MVQVTYIAAIAAGLLGFASASPAGLSKRADPNGPDCYNAGWTADRAAAINAIDNFCGTVMGTELSLLLSSAIQLIHFVNR